LTRVENSGISQAFAQNFSDFLYPSNIQKTQDFPGFKNNEPFFINQLPFKVSSHQYDQGRQPSLKPGICIALYNAVTHLLIALPMSIKI